MIHGIHENRSAQSTETSKGDRRLLSRYETEVAAYAAALGHAERRGARGKIDRLQARLAMFEHECAVLAEYLAEYNGADVLTEERP